MSLAVPLIVRKMGGTVFLTDFTIGKNSIKKYKLNVNQRRKNRMEQQCPT